MQPFTHTLFTQPLSLLSRPFHVRLNGTPKISSTSKNQSSRTLPDSRYRLPVTGRQQGLKRLSISGKPLDTAQGVIVHAIIVIGRLVKLFEGRFIIVYFVSYDLNGFAL